MPKNKYHPDLTPRELKILASRFGAVEYMKPVRLKTYEEIGLEWDLTRDRISQIINGAIKKIIITMNLNRQRGLKGKKWRESTIL